MTTAVAASSFQTSLTRYGRSTGLWVLLLVAPVGARFMVAERGATQSLVAVHERVPWLTSQVLGMVIGVVIATLLLPVAYIYLRANVTRRQPWQVQEPTIASRISIAYGRWAADLAILAAVLAATTVAGVLLAYLLIPAREVHPLVLAAVLWVIAGPPLAMVASVRILLDARRGLRGPGGDVVFFLFWLGAIAFAAAGDHVRGYQANMYDLCGFMSPIGYAQGSSMTGKGNSDFSIGGNLIKPGSRPIVLDVVKGVEAPGYLPARLTWLGLAALVPLLAGLVYAPHVAGKIRRRPRWLKFLDPGKARPARAGTPPAGASRWPAGALVLAEIRLIASGRPMMLAMAAAAVLSVIMPWTALGGRAAMLLLLFAATAHAGRSEQTGLLALTRTGLLPPMARRLAFLVAGTALMLVMTLGGVAKSLIAGHTGALVEVLAVGGGTTLIAIALGALTRSATAPRLVLLILWYGYLNWKSAGG